MVCFSLEIRAKNLLCIIHSHIYLSQIGTKLSFNRDNNISQKFCTRSKMGIVRIYIMGRSAEIYTKLIAVVFNQKPRLLPIVLSDWRVQKLEKGYLSQCTLYVSAFSF